MQIHHITKRSRLQTFGNKPSNTPHPSKFNLLPPRFPHALLVNRIISFAAIFAIRNEKSEQDKQE